MWIGYETLAWKHMLGQMIALSEFSYALSLTWRAYKAGLETGGSRPSTARGPRSGGNVPLLRCLARRPVVRVIVYEEDHQIVAEPFAYTL